MRKKFLKLRSKRQLLEVVFNGQNNICAYTKNIPVDREDQSDQTLGTGKTHGIILSMYELYGLNLCPVTMDYVDLDGKAGSYWCSGCRDFHDIVVPKFILATNIQFSKRTRTGYVRVGGIPGKVHYVETMGELALLAAKERMEYPDREVLCVIDEFPGFLDHLHSQDTEARELRDLLDLTRKLRICFLGIGPIYDDFVIHFRKRAPFHLFKDPLRVEQLRGTSNYVSDPELREKMAKASVKNTMFVKGKVGSKWIDTVVWVKSCPWTKFPPPVGGFCYETEAFAPFSMGEEFSKNFRYCP